MLSLSVTSDDDSSLSLSFLVRCDRHSFFFVFACFVRLRRDVSESKKGILGQSNRTLFSDTRTQERPFCRSTTCGWSKDRVDTTFVDDDDDDGVVHSLHVAVMEQRVKVCGPFVRLFMQDPRCLLLLLLGGTHVHICVFVRISSCESVTVSLVVVRCTVLFHLSLVFSSHRLLYPYTLLFLPTVPHHVLLLLGFVHNTNLGHAILIDARFCHQQ